MIIWRNKLIVYFVYHYLNACILQLVRLILFNTFTLHEMWCANLNILDILVLFKFYSKADLTVCDYRSFGYGSIFWLKVDIDCMQKILSTFLLWCNCVDHPHFLVKLLRFLVEPTKMTNELRRQVCNHGNAKQWIILYNIRWAVYS